MTKQELRKQIKQTLINNSQSLPEFSGIICSKILASPEYKNAETLLAYMPLKDEVDLLPVIQDALAAGKKVFLPKVNPSSPEMEFYKITSAESVNTITAGAFGIKEPEIGTAYNPGANPKTLVLVPGRGFTASGCRLGRGKAYYDTYFSGLKGKLTLAGICFNCQLLKELPVESHDVFMDLIITEENYVNCNSKREC